MRAPLRIYLLLRYLYTEEMRIRPSDKDIYIIENGREDGALTLVYQINESNTWDTAISYEPLPDGAILLTEAFTGIAEASSTGKTPSCRITDFFDQKLSKMTVEFK